MKNLKPLHLNNRNRGSFLVWLIRNLSSVAAVAVAIAVFFSIQIALARPEYAASTGLIQCSQCHVSPLGGGARNTTGKLYGSRDYVPAWTSSKDLASLDVRMLGFHSKRAPGARASKGLAIMNVIPTVNVPLTPQALDNSASAEAAGSMRLVASYNFAPLGPGMRDTFLLMPLSSEPAFFQTILVGNFNSPFGLKTDEHRTYTKVMVNASNREFETGAVLSGAPGRYLNYDLALVNGFQSGGSIVANPPPDPWGAILNIRAKLGSWPILVGFSQSEHGTSALENPLDATSLYFVYAFDQHLGPRFRGSLSTEFVWARGWNNATYNSGAGSGITYFIPTTAPAWQAGLNNSVSTGWISQLNLDLTRRWTIQLKHEEFLPDQNYTADFFYRNGVGLKYFMSSNASLIARYDNGGVTRKGLNQADLSAIKAVGDEVFLVLHTWL